MISMVCMGAKWRGSVSATLDGVESVQVEAASAWNGRPVVVLTDSGGNRLKIASDGDDLPEVLLAALEAAAAKPGTAVSLDVAREVVADSAESEGERVWEMRQEQDLIDHDEEVPE